MDIWEIYSPNLSDLLSRNSLALYKRLTFYISLSIYLSIYLNIYIYIYIYIFLKIIPLSGIYCEVIRWQPYFSYDAPIVWSYANLDIFPFWSLHAIYSSCITPKSFIEDFLSVLLLEMWRSGSFSGTLSLTEFM